MLMQSTSYCVWRPFKSKKLQSQMVGSLKGRSSDIVQSRCTNPILKANKNQTMHSNGWSWSLSRRSPQKCSDAAASPSGWKEPSSRPFFGQNLKILTICFAMDRGDCEFAKSSVSQSVCLADKTRQDKGLKAVKRAR